MIALPLYPHKLSDSILLPDFLFLEGYFVEEKGESNFSKKNLILHL